MDALLWSMMFLYFFLRNGGTPILNIVLVDTWAEQDAVIFHTPFSLLVVVVGIVAAVDDVQWLRFKEVKKLQHGEKNKVGNKDFSSRR